MWKYVYDMQDIHITPLTWHTAWRLGLSLIGTLVTLFTLWLVSATLTWIAGVPNPLDLTILGLIGLLLFINFIRPEAEIEVVPETNFGAVVTWFGTPTFLIRTSGPYTWTGKRLLFDRSRKINVTVTDENGFVKLGQIAFQVWKSSAAKNDPDRSSITVPAKNRALVKMRFTVTFTLKWARRWLSADNPELTLGDQARQENQELVKDINDTDAPAIQPDMDKFVQGKPIITAFIPESVEGHKEGAMIRNRSGLAMYTLLQAKGEGMETIVEAVARFRNELDTHAHPKMLALIKANGEAMINILKVSDPITDVMAELGAEAEILSFSDITASEIVSTAAAIASSESDQRTAQLASARTQAEARRLNAVTQEERNSQSPAELELARILAAAQDNPEAVKVVHVTGNNPLATAAVVGASQIKGATNP